MTEPSSLRLADELTESESQRRLRRLKSIRELMQSANRRSAGPFSHPFAIHGSLTKLREQISDVSRVADAVLMNAELAETHRFEELCSDIKGLLQTQQRWTERLENQIWRLESQISLMKRLQHMLLDRSPGNDRLWELCEVIARDTQSLPTGMLLLPEPGHRIVLANGRVSSRASWSIEQARLAVFSAITLLPDVRGADIVAQTLQGSAATWLEYTEKDYDTSAFSETQWRQRAVIANPNKEVARLIDLTGRVMTKTDELSQSAAGLIAPPMIEQFYGALSTAIEADSIADNDIAMAVAICHTLGLPVVESQVASCDRKITDDAAITFTHKLRWHDGSARQTDQVRASTRSRMRRPNFGAVGSGAAALTVFAREE